MTLLDDTTTTVATPPTAPVEVLPMAAAINRALGDAMAADPSVVVMGEDVGALGGVFRVTEGLTARFGEDRCIDTPLAESGIVGMALGMAMNGMRPVVEMQFDAFSYPAFEQVVSHVAKMANRTRGLLTAPMVIRVPFGGGIGGVEHHSDSSEAYWAHTPGLVVVSPSTSHDAYAMMRAAIDSPDPVVFLEPKRLYWANGPVDTGLHAGLSGARIVRDGTDVTLIAYAACVPLALKAAEALAAEGRSAQVVDVRCLSPLDDATLTAAVRSTGRAVVISEAASFGSVAGEIQARIFERCFETLLAPVRRVTGFDVPSAPPAYEHWNLPDVDRILDAVDTLHWDDRGVL